LKNKLTALITGASGEIGGAIAQLLADSNIDLVLVYNNNSVKIEEVQRKCPKVQVTAIQVDLSSYNNIVDLVIDLEQKRIYPDILINAIGVSHYGLIQDIEYEEWQSVININQMAPFFLTQKLVPKMISSRFGRIINISSIWGEKGAANEVLYSMTKGAINTFTKALAKELAPSNVTVNAIAVGVINSKMLEGFNEDELAQLRDQIPMGRFANPLEVAQLVLHLLQNNSSYITGQIIGVDGGWS